MNVQVEEEGYLNIHGRNVWYKIVGKKEEPGRIPLLVLHGGPGGNSLYMDPLKVLAASGRRVIFYDQLGSGKSDRLKDTLLFTVPNYVQELAEVRRQLKLDTVHLLGQSWGGMLAMEYYLGGGDKGVASLTLSDSLASFNTWMSEAGRLRQELPSDTQATLKKHEQAATTDSKEYQDAMMVYYNRHLCRLDPWPEFLQQSFAQLSPEVYEAMWGPSEFHANGSLTGWDIRPRLGDIKVPTLILSGRHDESTPQVSGELYKGITGAKWVIFENSSHLPHIEERDLYLKTVEEFLSAVEAARISK
ncbi:MAG: proline iminopeptidase-family hydrolase [Elusimicrobia bacterium]|nr:proline iminopeptidase-family hydrolase [Elusimicrobiota bacterium]